MKTPYNYFIVKLVKYSLAAFLMLILALLTYRAEKQQKTNFLFEDELLFAPNTAFTGIYLTT